MVKHALKTLLRSHFVQWMLAFLIASYAWLVWVTSKITVQKHDTPEKFPTENSPVIMALWHGELLLMPLLFRRTIFHKNPRVSALISASRDGRLIAKAAWFYGIRCVSGSSSKGGMAAFRELLRRAKSGETLFITPDGPRGPRHACSKGTVELARLSGLPIIPVRISYAKFKQAGSWDKFILPALFNTVTIHFGGPVFIPKEAESRAFRLHVEDALSALAAPVKSA